MQKEFSVWSLFSDDDNVCLFLTEAEALKTMKDGVQRRRQQGVDPID